jgi:hypothetical protein
MKGRGAAVAVLVASTAGCSGVTSSPNAIYCDVPYTVMLRHYCDVYTFPEADAGDAMQFADMACQTNMGTIVPACPTAGELGSCAIAPSMFPSRPTTETFYDDGGFKVADAQLVCVTQVGGTWMP